MQLCNDEQIELLEKAGFNFKLETVCHPYIIPDNLGNGIEYFITLYKAFEFCLEKGYCIEIVLFIHSNNKRIFGFNLK